MKLILERFKKEFSYEEISPGYYNDDGEYVEGQKNSYLFKGALLPLSEKDLQFLEDGSYSIDDQKLYTDLEIKSNTIITDVENSNTYKVYALRGYNIIDKDFKRYFMKRVDAINA